MASAGQRSLLGTLGILWLNYSGVMVPCSGRHQGISATLVFSGSMASIELRSKLEPQKRIQGRSLGEPMNSMPAASKEPLAADFRIETFSRAFTRLVAAIRNNINLALKDDLRLGSEARSKWEWMVGFFNAALTRHSLSIQPFTSLPFPE
jgi:hypothetical protein